MSHVNFIEKKKLTFNYFFMIIIVFTLFITFSFVSVIQTSLNNKYDNLLRQTSKQVSFLKSKVKEKGSFLENITEGQSEFLESLNYQVDWEQVLQSVSHSASKKVWLDQIETKLLPNPSIYLHGSAKSSQAIGKFVKLLKRSEQFKKVVVNEAGVEPLKKDDKSHQFKIQCEL